MNKNLRNSIFAGLAFALVITPVIAIFYHLFLALIIGPVAAILFGQKLYSFATSKEVARQTEIAGTDANSIVYSDSVNHFMNREAVGGKLYLFSDRLQFKSHNHNIQNHETIIELKEIDEVGFYNTLGLIPNGLFIATTDAKKEKFVVNDRKLWKENIETSLDKIIKF